MIAMNRRYSYRRSDGASRVEDTAADAVTEQQRREVNQDVTRTEHVLLHYGYSNGRSEVALYVGDMAGGQCKRG